MGSGALAAHYRDATENSLPLGGGFPVSQHAGDSYFWRAAIRASRFSNSYGFDSELVQMVAV